MSMIQKAGSSLTDPNHLNHAQNIFKDTGIKFTCEEKHHLCAVIGSDDFKSEYVRKKITNWTQEIIKLNRVFKNTTACCIHNLLPRSSP